MSVCRRASGGQGARPQGRSEAGPDQGAGPHDPSSHGPPGHIGLGTVQGLGISPVILYRYVDPQGNLRDHVQNLATLDRD